MRLSRFLVPLKKVAQPQKLDTVDLLVNNGYIKQSSSGVFNILPLGLRVQQRIESIIRKRLNNIECQETSLAILAETEIWKKSGRFENAGELFSVRDKPDDETSRYLMAPTNEEEITQLVASEVHSYRQLPLRLYQIGKKFRNEMRPRGGLLRAREFVMKDLYTFDNSEKEALATYEEVREAYRNIFKDLGAPFSVAEADTGAIGGSLSHEFHYLTDVGEDTVAHCEQCSYTANVEKASYIVEKSLDKSVGVNVEYFLSEDKDTLVAAYYPETRELNPLAIKQDFPLCEEDIDPIKTFIRNESINKRLLRLIDPLVHEAAELPEPGDELERSISKRQTTTLNAEITVVEAGDICPECEKSPLKLSRAIEVGHTFYLGSKYTKPFSAKVQTKEGGASLIEMGCYGIGVSRLISAIAEVCRDDQGLIWPASVAPFQVLVVAGQHETGLSITKKLNDMGISAVFDDRSKQFGALLGQAKSLGFPYTVIAGKKFAETGELEVQPRTSKDSVFSSIENLGQSILALSETAAH